MANERKLLVRIIGDDKSLHQAFSRSSSGAAKFDRDIGRATRGALAGSGVFRGLGRSIAFASGGFLAFATAGQFLRTSIDAAKEAAVTQAQLSAQFRASGKDIRDYQGVIDKTANRLSLLAGFENDEVKAGFITIFRTTKDVSKALRDTATAADLARAKHLDFAQASLLVAKTEAGNTTLLRRQGFQIAKNATVEQALARLRRIVAGQARAGTTDQERFGAVLHDTEEIVGVGLLPILNRYLARGAVWLTQMNESGRLQKDVARITGDVATVTSRLVGVFRAADRVTGSLENTLKDFAEVWLLLKVRTLLAAAGLNAVAAAEIAVGESAVVSRIAAYTGAIGTLGTTAVAAEAEVAGLAGLLKKVALFAPALITLANQGESQRGRPPGSLKAPSGAFIDPKTGHFVGTFNGKTVDLGAAPATRAQGIEPIQTAANNFFAKQAANVLKRLRPSQGGTTGTDPRRPLSLQGRFNLADFALAKAQAANNIRLQRQALVLEASITKEEITQAKTLAKKTTLTKQLDGILSQIRGIDEQATADAKAQAQAAKDAAKAARERAQAALQAREFRVLGLDPTGQPFAPGLKALRAELANVGKKIKGTTLDTKKNEGLLGNITKLLFGKDANHLTKDVRSTVQQLLDTLRDSLKDASGGPVTKFAKANTKALLAGLGLDPAEIKAVRARLSQIGAGGTVPRGSAGAGGGGRLPDIVVPITFQMDGRAVSVNTTRHQQKDARRNPKQKRGPHA